MDYPIITIKIWLYTNHIPDPMFNDALLGTPFQTEILAALIMTKHHIFAYHC